MSVSFLLFTDNYCDHPEDTYVMMSTPSEYALLQTTDLQVKIIDYINMQPYDITVLYSLLAYIPVSICC